MLFSSEAKEVFEVEPITSAKLEAVLAKCANIYNGNPPWVNADEHIITVNFAKSVCSETARLATLGIKITVGGKDGAKENERSKWLQEQIDNVYYRLRDWVEFGCGYGAIVLKPNGEDVDVVTPDRFMVTAQKNNEATGAVFIDKDISGNGKVFYTRLEYHRFLDNGNYAITNKVYKSDAEGSLGKEIEIEESPWKRLLADVEIQSIDKPLFAVMKTPQANNVDIQSPMGVPVYAEAVEELKDLDIAYSRNALEVKESRRIVLLDSDRMMEVGMDMRNMASGLEKSREHLKLPEYIKNVYGDGAQTFYQEINPTLQTAVRVEGINALLSQIGYKCGFSNGYFVFNQHTGLTTATQIESEQQRTIQFIKDVRDKLEHCIDGLLYALNAFADLYDLAPLGDYEATYDFGDITYNREEDKARWYGYVAAGKIPFWYYLNKFEGMTEEEAKELDEMTKKEQMEAAMQQQTLFGGFQQAEQMGEGEE